MRCDQGQKHAQYSGSTFSTEVNFLKTYKNFIEQVVLLMSLNSTK